MGLKDMIGNLRDGLGIRKIRQLGPLGTAVEALNKVLEEAIKTGAYDKSVTMRSIHVVIDNSRLQRLALEAAASYISWVEAKPEWSPANEKTAAALLADFKAKAVKAKLHQYVPFDKLPAFHQQAEGKA